MKKECYRIDGMSCAACSSAVERVTRKLDGVIESEVKLTTARMTITYDETKVTKEQIEKKGERAGFKASLLGPEKERKEEKKKEQEKEEALEKTRSCLLYTSIRTLISWQKISTVLSS